MNAVAKRPKRPSKPQKPLYFVARRALLVDHTTGEILPEQVSVLAPSTQWDVRAMRTRGYKVGQTVRARIERPRNPKFNGMAHALGALIVDHGRYPGKITRTGIAGLRSFVLPDGRREARATQEGTAMTEKGKV